MDVLNELYPCDACFITINLFHYSFPLVWTMKSNDLDIFVVYGLVRTCLIGCIVHQ